MTLQDNIDDLITAKNKIAKVYKDEVSDENFDNGNLTNMNNAILSIELAIKFLKLRL